MERLECMRLLGLAPGAGELSPGAIRSAFRRAARRCHPDAVRVRGGGVSSFDFKELVCARDILLLEADACARGRSAAAFGVWSLYSRVGLARLFGYVERLMMGDRAYHGVFVRMASILGDGEFTRRVYSLVNRYYSERLRVVRLSATLREMLDGLVRVWCDGAAKLFVPLWHTSLLYEDNDVYFVVQSDALITGDGLCDYIVGVEGVVVRSVSYAISPETNDLSLHIELGTDISACAVGAVGAGVGFYLRLAEGREVWVDMCARADVLHEYAGCGLYRVNEEDVFDVSERADVRVTYWGATAPQ